MEVVSIAPIFDADIRRYIKRATESNLKKLVLVRTQFVSMRKFHALLVFFITLISLFPNQ